MLETALVIIVFFVLIGAIFDLGVAMYQFGMLRHTTNKAARDITVALASAAFPSPPSDPCTKFNQIANTYLTTKATPLMATGGTAAARVGWRYCMRDGVPLRSFHVIGDMPLNCFFICRFMPNAWHVTADADATMDSSRVPTCGLNPPC